MSIVFKSSDSVLVTSERKRRSVGGTIEYYYDGTRFWLVSNLTIALTRTLEDVADSWRVAEATEKNAYGKYHTSTDAVMKAGWATPLSETELYTKTSGRTSELTTRKKVAAVSLIPGGTVAYSGVLKIELNVATFKATMTDSPSEAYTLQVTPGEMTLQNATPAQIRVDHEFEGGDDFFSWYYDQLPVYTYTGIATVAEDGEVDGEVVAGKKDVVVTDVITFFPR